MKNPCPIPKILNSAEFTGHRFEVRPDPSDNNYDLVSMRLPSARALGARGPTPCNLEGEHARRRIVQFQLANVYGILVAKGLENVAYLISHTAAAIEREDEQSDRAALGKVQA